MTNIVKRNFDDLKNAWKSLNYYEEALFYMDFFWGLHPHFQGIIPLVKFCFFFVVSCGYVGLGIVMVINEYAGIETLKKTDILSPSIQITYILFSYKLNRNTLQRLIEKTEKFLNVPADLSEDVEKKLQMIRYFICTYKLTILATTIYYNIVALTYPDVLFPTDCYYFCNVENLVCYCTIFVFVDLNAFILVWGIYTFDGFFAGIVSKVIIQLKIIKYKLEHLDLKKSTKEAEINEVLRNIIQHHAFLLEFLADINTLYARILFTQFSSLIFSMCIGSFLLTLHGVPTVKTLAQYVAYLLCMFGQVFIYSFGGQVILDESSGIADSAYYTNWYDAKIKRQKAVSTIILRAQQKSNVSVGGIANLDLRMYLYASKTAFSFYAMMNQIYRKNLELSYL